MSYDTETGASPSVVRGPHGTACGGIAGAADNGIGVSGVAPDCGLMSISNKLHLTVDIKQKLADGLNWAWKNGADVISNSWGANDLLSNYIDDAISNAVTHGRDGLGCVVVFSSGNGNGAVNYPASSDPNILTVGAISPCGERKSPSSCDGEGWGSSYGAELDVVAPGVLISTTDVRGAAGYNPNEPIHLKNAGRKVTSDYADQDYTVWFNGTSAACPHVAGVAALVLSVRPDLTGQQVRDIIEKTAQKVGGYNYAHTAGRPNGTWHREMGYGLVDAHAAVVYALTNGASISGPSTLLTRATYTLGVLPDNMEVTWSASGGVAVLESTRDNGRRATFRQVGFGAGVIHATIRRDGEVLVALSHSIATPTPTISGAASICDAASHTYTLSGLPGDARMAWSCSDNLRITGEQDGAGVTVRRTDEEPGAGWLHADVALDSTSVRVSHRMRLGGLLMPPRVTGPHNAFPLGDRVCVGHPVYFMLLDDPADLYEWALHGPGGGSDQLLSADRDQQVKYDFSFIPSREGIHTLRCRRYDAECGWTPFAEVDFYAQERGCPPRGWWDGVLLSPNPASGVVTVAVDGEADAGVRESGEAARGVESASIRLVEVYDWQGQRVLRREFGGGQPSVTVGLEGLRPGVYTVVVNGAAQERLVVE